MGYREGGNTVDTFNQGKIQRIRRKFSIDFRRVCCRYTKHEYFTGYSYGVLKAVGNMHGVWETGRATELKDTRI